MEAKFISGTKEIMWIDNHSVGEHRGSRCERISSIPTRYKLFTLIAIIVIQGVIIISYKQGCRSTLCLGEQSLIIQSMVKQSSTGSDDERSRNDEHLHENKSRPLKLTGQGEDGTANHAERQPVGDAVTHSDTNMLKENAGGPHYDPNAPFSRHLPHFIIIGVKKCGSRALLNYLGIHPDIAVARKEVHFFDRPENFMNGMDWYLQQMPPSQPHMLTGEKSPAYYRTKEVPEQIYAMNSSIKLLCIVKEPINRALSNYLQYQSKALDAGVTDFKTFEESILNEDGTINPKSQHIYNSDYNLYLGRWLKYFPREQLHFVDGNMLIKDPARALERVQTFLGIQRYINDSFFQFNEEKGFFCYRESLFESFTCLNDSKGRPHPTMQPDTRLKLSNYFKPRNIMFFRNMGESFDWDT